MTAFSTSWLRKGAFAVAAVALLTGAPLRAFALPLVGVYEKSGFEYVVNLGDSSSLSSVSYNANIAEFGGSTAGALFTIVGVVDRNLVDSATLPVGNVVFTTLTSPTASSLTVTGITSAQQLVAGFGTSDSWFDLIPAIISGGAGAHATLQATAANAFEVKVGNDFFGAFPFQTTGTIDGNGNLHISLYSAIAGSDFDTPPTPKTVTKLFDLNVSSGGLAKAPEPTSLVLLGVALAAGALLRRQA